MGERRSRALSFVGDRRKTRPKATAQREGQTMTFRSALAAAGFVTPALDGLITEPSSLRFHSINDIINELDVIAG